MKFKIILIGFLSLISFSIQQSTSECSSLSEPSQEKCNNIFPLNTECCFVETTSSSSCKEYYPDLINFYVEDKLKYRKTDLLTSYLLNNDIESLETNQIISELESRLIDIEKIYCNSVTKEISYSSIKYTEDDIEKAKQDNFCGKLMLESEITEEQCVNGIVFPDLANAGEKCCYAEVYSETTQDKYYACFSFSKAQRENEKYLESLIPKDYIESPSKAKIVCNGYNKQYFYDEGRWIEKSQEEICEEVKNPSKETCNDIEISNSECCYDEYIFSSENRKQCKVYNPELSNINGFEQVILNYYKLDLILNNLPDKKYSTDYDSLISDLKSQIPKTQTINCNTASKSIDYSSITITKEDIINAEKDNFCPILEGNINPDSCSIGVLFSDFASAGGQCCYLEILFQEQNEKYKKCFPLSKIERENKALFSEVLKNYESYGQYMAILDCNGSIEKYDSSTRKWTVVQDSSFSNFIKAKYSNLLILLLLLILLF